MAIYVANPGDNLQDYFNIMGNGDTLQLNSGIYRVSDAGTSYSISKAITVIGLGNVQLYADANVGGVFFEILNKTSVCTLENLIFYASTVFDSANFALIRLGSISVSPVTIANEVHFKNVEIYNTRYAINIRNAYTVKIWDSYFHNLTAINSSSQRAGIYQPNNLSPTTTNTYIYDTIMDTCCRALWLYHADSSINLNGCTIRNNHTLVSEQSGLGLFLQLGSASIKNSTFENNQTIVTATELFGAAIYAYGQASNIKTLDIENCLFNNNSILVGRGGAIATHPTIGYIVNISNSTFYNNFHDGTPLNLGHAVYIANGPGNMPTFTNNIFSQNGSNEYCVNIQNPVGFHVEHHNIFHGTQPKFTKDPTSLTLNPLFEDNFYINPSSPAINAGDAYAKTKLFYQQGYNSSVKNIIDTGLVDLGYHHIVDVPDPRVEVGGYNIYSWTSKIYEFGPELSASGVMSKLITHLEWDNEIGSFTGEYFGNDLWQVVSGLSLANEYAPSTLAGHSLEQSGSIFRILDNDSSGLLTVSSGISTGDAVLCEGQLRYYVSLHAGEDVPLWLLIYDSLSPLFGGVGTDLRDVEITYSGGIDFQFYLEMFLPSGAHGNLYAYTELVQGRILPGMEVDVKDPTTGKVIARGSTGNDGRYKIPVPPGAWNLSYEGMGARRESAQINVPFSHGGHTLRFGEDVKETFLQWRRSNALQQVGDIGWTSFAVYEDFINHLNRLGSEPYPSGLLEDGYWYMHHTFVDWLYVGLDPHPDEMIMDSEGNSKYFITQDELEEAEKNFK